MASSIPSRLTLRRHDMKLHLGCGKRYQGDSVNVDRFDRTVADYVADARQLPFADGSISSIVALQMIEHLGYTGAIYALAEWYRVLEQEGELVVETPDPAGAFGRFLSARTPEAKDHALGWIFGDEAPGFTHTFLYPPELLELMLHRAGFEVVELGEPTSYRTEPGFRSVCRRVPSRAAQAMSKTRVRMFDVIRTFDDPSEVAELENGLVEHLMAVAEGGAEDLTPHLEVALITWSRATLWYLEELEETEQELSEDLRSWAPTVAELVEFGVSGRMTAMIEPSSRRGPWEGHLYDEIAARGVRMIRELRSSGRSAEQCWESAFDGKPPEPVGEVFTASQVQHLAEVLHARALKSWLTGDRTSAVHGLERVCRTGTGQLYALWNLSRLAALEGDFDRASSCLERALLLADNREAGPLINERARMLSRVDRDQTPELVHDLADGGKCIPELDLSPVALGEIPHE